jgi:hypothetical protein
MPSRAGRSEGRMMIMMIMMIIMIVINITIIIIRIIDYICLLTGPSFQVIELAGMCSAELGVFVCVCVSVYV